MQSQSCLKAETRAERWSGGAGAAAGGAEKCLVSGFQDGGRRPVDQEMWLGPGSYKR